MNSIDRKDVTAAFEHAVAVVSKSAVSASIQVQCKYNEAKTILLHYVGILAERYRNADIEGCINLYLNRYVHPNLNRYVYPNLDRYVHPNLDRYVHPNLNRYVHPYLNRHVRPYLSRHAKWKLLVGLPVFWLVWNLITLSAQVPSYFGGISESDVLYLTSVGWSKPSQKGYGPSETVLVCITHNELSSYDALQSTVTDALSSPQAAVFVYTSSMESFSRLRRDRKVDISMGRLAMRITEAMNTTELGQSLVDDMNLAYLLDFAAQHKEDARYTMVLKAGMSISDEYFLLEYNYSEYATPAILQYTAQEVETSRRNCWMTLSDPSVSRDEIPAFMIDTAEHAARMAITLRSGLPYRTRRAVRLILDEYCPVYLWEAKPFTGPVLFHPAIPPEPANETAVSIPQEFLNASKFPTPPWIDSSVPAGPCIVGNGTYSYSIVFGVATMPRPNNTTNYLEQFMMEIIQIVEIEFSVPTSNSTIGDPTYQALVVLLISGNSLDDIARHRQFLEAKYDSSIARGIVKLVDAPFESYQLDTLHNSFPEDPPDRRYWRSKQNLDIAATLHATAGLSDYVMLVEDDTGFQPGFAADLKSFMEASSQEGEQPFGIPRWAVAEYGFGYSGILLHSSDIFVYQQLHRTFYDEKPCDHLKLHVLVRGREKRHPSSPAFENGRWSFFKHLGEFSTLPGKTQPVWR
jgi:N-Acetylglucosaminyltransferase-IV (GnT-IV) conserved region